MRICKSTFGLTAGLLLGFAAACIAQAPAGANIPQLPELNWEQHSDWLNVRSAAQMAGIGPAAVGDGVADDTEALQAAFDKVRIRGSLFSAVYFPPGTYRITKEIYPKVPDWLNSYQSLHIYGHGRSTRIVWDGPEGGTMFRSVKLSHSIFVGIVWDGRGKAARGFVHDGGNDTYVLHEHEAFMNFTEQGSGTTKGPRAVEGYLEGSMWRNCLFIKCGKGLPFWQFNDYVITIDGCSFYDCDYGIWSERGNFYARNCHFERSSQADIANMNDTHGSSARRVTSVGSRTFYYRGGTYGVQFTMQDCHVSGWKNPDYAVLSSSLTQLPMLIFDCTFTHAPSANPPIRLEGPTPLVHSNNIWSTGGALVGGMTEQVQEVPPGQRGGSVTSAQQSFFRSEAAIPTRVFDAKRDFGAAGDGSTDDTYAVQACIDAARQNGNGAIAYLPRGRYRVNRTIHITGGNYYVGGAGCNPHMVGSANVTWSGDKVGPVFLVSDPQNVTIQGMQIISPSGVPGIRQVSTVLQPSRMHYEHLEVGIFEAVGLSKESVLTATSMGSFVGTMLFDNCSSARILLNYVVDPNVRVKGTQLDRNGFMGVQASQSQFLIEDNQSFVGSDCYQEQMGFRNIGRDIPYAILRGSPTLPPGRVTLSSPKLCGFPIPGNPDWRQEPFEEYFIVDNYRGRLSSVASDYYNPTPTYDPDKKAFRIVCSGEAPLDVLLMANSYGRVKPEIEGDNNVTRNLYGNWFVSGSTREPIPNVLTPNTLTLASLALDDFRELGALDLELNHGASILKLNQKPEELLLLKGGGDVK